MSLDDQERPDMTIKITNSSGVTFTNSKLNKAMFTVGGVSFSVTCPKCNSKKVTIGSMKIDKGVTEITGVTCSACGHTDNETRVIK